MTLVNLILRFALLATAMLSLAFACSAQVFPTPEGEILAEYDRFTDQTSVSLLQVQVAEKQYELDYQRLYLSVFTQFKGAHPTAKPDFLGIIFSSWSLWDDRYLEPASLNAIVDDERKSYGAAIPLKRRVINGKHAVNLGGRIAYPEFLKLINAKKVEMRLGDVEFSLDDHAFKMLRDFARRIQ